MDDWKALITRFSDFGGIAHNIQYKKGQYGLGIFPKIQGEEIKIQVPDRLMINLKDVGYKNNKLFLMNAGKYPRGYAEWFNFYQQKFAYGANAGKEISQVFTDAKKFDKETLDIALKTTLLQNINPNKPLQLQYASKFLTARCIDYKGKPHVFPIIELINHDYKGGRYEKSNSNEGGGITVKMKPTNEVLVAYNLSLIHI